MNEVSNEGSTIFGQLVNELQLGTEKVRKKEEKDRYRDQKSEISSQLYRLIIQKPQMGPASVIYH